MAGGADDVPGKPLTGIKEVARIAGVSLGTVSNVLNRPEKVSPATRTRVEAVIDRLGFVPNSTAAELRRGHGRLIGLVVPDITNPVFVDRAVAAQEYCSASVDDVHGGQLAIEHLLGCGASKLVMINGPRSLRQCADRRRGARRAVKSAGLPETALTEVVSDVMSIAGGVDAAARALQLRPDLDALFCANDLLAIGAIRVLQGARDVPRDVSVIGYDDIAIAADSTVPLTSVAQPKYELGRAAGELLLREIRDGEHHRHERILFQPEVTVRSSTRSAAQAMARR